MKTNVHVGTFVAGALITIMALVLLTEGLGWWELHRSDLPYLVPLLVILMGVTTIASSLNSPDADQGNRR